MGVIAPVAAVLGAGIPTLFGIFAEGMPRTITLAGFLLAGIGIWLISGGPGPAGRPRGLVLAVLSGLGFAGYFLCIKQADAGSPLWLAGLSRAASLVATGTIVAATRQFQPLPSSGVAGGAGGTARRWPCWRLCL